MMNQQFAFAEKCEKLNTTNFKIVCTSDIHGNFFNGSLSKIFNFINTQRGLIGDNNLILLDNGDILQGTPDIYYYNFVDTASEHIVSKVYRLLHFDAASVGNHDIECGKSVYNRIKANKTTPILAANIIDVKTNKPYFQPYHILNKNGFKIAVLGLTTTVIPATVPKQFWDGLRFDDMEESAKYWVDYIKNQESPDLIIGLFHSGADSNKTVVGYKENESVNVAKNVNGFDAIFMGHDHTLFCDTIKTNFGKSIHVLNPANNAKNLAVLTIDVKDKSNLKFKGELICLDNYNSSLSYDASLSNDKETVEYFINKVIGKITKSINASVALEGPSEFMSLIHDIQLKATNADISFAAPLSLDCKIEAGDIKIKDAFQLYKYDNFLSVVSLTGKEIKDYLEYSYDLLFDSACEPTYNLDSAQGIDYEVDPKEQKGKRVKISQLSNGKEFNLDSTYKVAMNSYRAGGGGNHLTIGCGIPSSLLDERVISTTEHDIRYYLINYIEENKIINPNINNNWRFQ